MKILAFILSLSLIGFTAEPLLHELLEIQLSANESSKCCKDGKCCCDNDCCDSESQQCNGDCQSTPFTHTVFTIVKGNDSFAYSLATDVLVSAVSNYSFIITPLIWHPPQIA